MTYKSRRSKACAISPKVKIKVFERDDGRCIFCHAPGEPVAHVIARSHGGLGIEQNIVTACMACHDRMDNSSDRATMQEYAMRYLRSIYPGWSKDKVIFKKGMT